MLKIMVACGNGMGSSMLIKTKVQNLFKKYEMEVSISHSSVGDAASIADQFDLIVCPISFADLFHTKKATVLPLQNIMSTEELEAKLKEFQIL